MFNAYYCLWYFTIYNLRFKTVLHGCDSRIFTSLLVFKAISCDHHLSLVDTWQWEVHSFILYSGHPFILHSFYWVWLTSMGKCPLGILLSFTHSDWAVNLHWVDTYSFFWYPFHMFYLLSSWKLVSNQFNSRWQKISKGSIS